MKDEKIDQLAAILKSSGLCASIYDARSMAASITQGVSQTTKDFESHLHRTGTGQRDVGFQPFNPQPRAAGGTLVSPVSPPRSEIFTNVSPPPVRQEVPVIPFVAPIAAAPVEAASTISLFSEQTSAPQLQEAPQDIVIEASQEIEVMQVAPSIAEVQPVLQPIVQQPVFTQQAPQPAFIPVQQPQQLYVEPVRPQAAPQRAPEVMPPQFQQPFSAGAPKPLIRGKALWEIEIDRSKPKAELTEAEKKATDINKWFYCGK